MTPYTPAELDDLQRLCDGATEGPWYLWSGIICHDEESDTVLPLPRDEGHGGPKENDAAFITASRTALPRLIAEVRKYREIAEKEAAKNPGEGKP